MSWIVWLFIWLVLIVGTGVGGVVLGRRLWRQTKVVMAAAEQSLALAEQFDRAATAAEERTQRYSDVAHLVATPDERRSWKQVRVTNGIARRGRKNVRRQRTLARWRAILTPAQ